VRDYNIYNPIKVYQKSSLKMVGATLSSNAPFANHFFQLCAQERFRSLTGCPVFQIRPGLAFLRPESKLGKFGKQSKNATHF